MSQEVKEPNQSKWYKKMYDTIHKQRNHNGNTKTTTRICCIILLGVLLCFQMSTPSLSTANTDVSILF